MPASPFDNIFDKVKGKARETAQQMNLVSQIAKLKVELATQKSEKERQLKAIGAKTYAIFAKEKTVDGKILLEEVGGELSVIQRIESRLEELTGEIAALQAEFRQIHGKDYVDAAEVKVSEDSPSGNEGQ